MDVSEIFFEVDDPRQSGKCYHELSDIIMIVFCGYLADCEGFEEVYDYACDKKELLSEFLELPCGIPSHDTATAARPQSSLPIDRPQAIRRGIDTVGQAHCGYIEPKTTRSRR